MCDQIRNLPSAVDFETVRIPGDRGNKKVREGMARGEIEIEDGFQGSLDRLLT